MVLSRDAQTIQNLASTNWSKNYIDSNLIVQRRSSWSFYRIVTYVLTLEFLKLKDPFQEIKWIHVADSLHKFILTHPELLENPQLTPSFESITEKLLVMKQKNFMTKNRESKAVTDLCIQTIRNQSPESSLPLVHSFAGKDGTHLHFAPLEEIMTTDILEYREKLVKKIKKQNIRPAIKPIEVQAVALLLAIKQLVDYPSIRFEPLNQSMKINQFFALKLKMPLKAFNALEREILKAIDYQTHIQDLAHCRLDF
ncbi:MAG: hypothetical protein KAR79_04525 [Simkaniaceae bacterium]|nr:hypothetical protein [Simkaniaceae bacterium]